MEKKKIEEKKNCQTFNGKKITKIVVTLFLRFVFKDSERLAGYLF